VASEILFRRWVTLTERCRVIFRERRRNLASSLLHSHDSFSYLLARLVAASCRRFVETCLWPHVARLGSLSGEEANAALIQFARSAFANRRGIVWPAQVAGIGRLGTNESFVLCTPTGSGKTTVATLGIVQSLFMARAGESPDTPIEMGTLALYLVPSRALAAEVAPSGRGSQRGCERTRGCDRPVRRDRLGSN
jgi:hypothetical protein